ncbi:MAG: type II secretion system GspH family protein [Mediterranea sp.]|jgi:prepilin-type N-terminal cleavage/methylation domain-containing protein|nr:type II secretion system GspH family protein [Mediterranea sp.]
MKRRPFLSCPCQAFTLPELLVVIILSGILFLAVFEGLNMVTRYSRLLRQRLIDKGELLYSHSVLEGLMDDTDSICRVPAEGRTLIFYRNGEKKCTLTPDSAGLALTFGSQQDTIFTRRAQTTLFPPGNENTRIDSIVVSVPMEGDTLTLTYAPI